MAKKIVLIGAGSAQFGFVTLGDIFQCRALRGSEVMLHDIDPESLQRIAKFAERFVDENGLEFTISATTSLTEALPGADYCIISIEVGDRFALWEQDWRIPQQYGIRQVYGENGGPGGLFHSLRIIPPILDICEDVGRICPDAYVFNYSNPMSRICTTVKRKYPDLKFIGLCHGIASIPAHLPRVLDTPLSNLEFRAGGLNHFSVLLEVKYKDSGKDAYPDVRKKAPGYFQDLPELKDLPPLQLDRKSGVKPEKSLDDARKTSRKWAERGLFKVILEKFGYLPITTDSHFGEYIQWAHEVVDHKGILDFYNWYKMNSQEMKRPRIELDSYEERVVPIIEGIETDSGHEEAAVNILNMGFIDDLPSDIVVEIPAIIGVNGITGIRLGSLPKGIAGLLYNQVPVHDLTAEAVLHQSRDLALQALLVDPVVDSLAAAEKTLETILELQKDYLSYLK